MFSNFSIILSRLNFWIKFDFYKSVYSTFVAVTQSVANIVEKWNFCYQKYKDGNPEDPENAPAVDSKCVCFERDNVEADPKMGIEGGTVSLFVILRTNLPKRNLRCAKKVRILKRF